MHVRIIIDHQDAVILRRGVRGDRRRLRLDRFASHQIGGQLDGKGRSFAGLAFHPDGSTHHFAKVFGDGQPQARAAEPARR